MTFREIAEKYDVSITTAYACTSDHRTYAPTEKIPMELIPEMVMEYRKGDLSLEAIAILYGLPNGGNSLIRYMKKEGISRKGHDTARLTEEKIRAVVDDYYNSDMTIGEVAEKHGVSARSVSKYAKEAKEADPSLKRLSEKKRRTPGDLDAIVEEFRTTGITMADLSAKHGIKESVIRAHVADMGLDYEELKKENAELRVPKAHDYDNHRLSEDRIRAIAEDYNNLNLTVRDLARKHGVSCFTVNKLLDHQERRGTQRHQAARCRLLRQETRRPY